MLKSYVLGHLSTPETPRVPSKDGRWQLDERFPHGASFGGQAPAKDGDDIGWGKFMGYHW